MALSLDTGGHLNHTLDTGCPVCHLTFSPCYLCTPSGQPFLSHQCTTAHAHINPTGTLARVGTTTQPGHRFLISYPHLMAHCPTDPAGHPAPSQQLAPSCPCGFRAQSFRGETGSSHQRHMPSDLVMHHSPHRALATSFPKGIFRFSSLLLLQSSIFTCHSQRNSDVPF